MEPKPLEYETPAPHGRSAYWTMKAVLVVIVLGVSALLAAAADMLWELISNLRKGIWP